MKKIVAILLVLLVASAFMFAKTCGSCNSSYQGNACPYCVGGNMAFNGEKDTCNERFNPKYGIVNVEKQNQCHNGYYDAQNKMSGSTSASEE